MECMDEEKNPAAVELGRRGGQKRAASLSKKRRKEIATQAVEARWAKAKAAKKSKKPL